MAQNNSTTTQATEATAVQLPAKAVENATANATTTAYNETVKLDSLDLTTLFTKEEREMLYAAIQPPPKQLPAKAQRIIDILDSMENKNARITVDLTNGDKSDTIAHLIASLRDAQSSPAVYHCHTAKGTKKGETKATAKPLTLAERIAQAQAQQAQ